MKFIIFLLIAVIGFSSCRNGENRRVERPFITLEQQDQTFQINLTIAPRIQNNTDRLWISYEIENLFTIGGIEDTTLLMPVRVKTDSEGNIYVVDQPASAVKKFDRKGNLVQTFGEGKGSGPGQFSVPFSLGVTGDGGLFVLDIGLNRITGFFSDGSYGNVYYTRHGAPGNVADMPDKESESSGNVFIEDDKIILWSLSGRNRFGNYVFDVYSLENGDYLYSFRLQGFGSVIDIEYSDGKFFTIHPDASLSVWKLKEAL